MALALCDNPFQSKQAVRKYVQCRTCRSPISTPSPPLPGCATSAPAGRVRGVSASSLSEAMRRLEARLGLRLLNRTTRSVTLTEAGQRLYDRLEPMLGGIGAAIEDINSLRDRPAGRLRLNVPGIVARLIMPDIACRFSRRSIPDITLEVISDDSFVDVLAEGFDAGVRYEESLHQDMIAIPIGPRRQRFVCAAAPAYLARHGTPAHSARGAGACDDQTSLRQRPNLQPRSSSATARPSWWIRRPASSPTRSRWSARPPKPGSVCSSPSRIFLVDSLAPPGGLCGCCQTGCRTFPGRFSISTAANTCRTALRAFVDFRTGRTAFVRRRPTSGLAEPDKFPSVSQSQPASY